MTDINHKIIITRDDFNKLRKDLHLLEEAYFGTPFNAYKTSVKIDYEETIRLISIARDLNKLNIKLNSLYEDFRMFVGNDGGGYNKNAGTAPDATEPGVNKNARNNRRNNMAGDAGNRHKAKRAGKDAGAADSGDNAGTSGGAAVSFGVGDAEWDAGWGAEGENRPDGIPETVITASENGDNFYNDFLFGLRREMPLSMTQFIDLHAKNSNVNITKELFKKIILEILNYEKNYNKRTFSSGSLYEVLRSDILSNKREILLPYVISNVLTYLKDTNFIGYYNAEGFNSFTVLDRDGLKLWASSIL